MSIFSFLVFLRTFIFLFDTFHVHFAYPHFLIIWDQRDPVLFKRFIFHFLFLDSVVSIVHVHRHEAFIMKLFNKIAVKRSQKENEAKHPLRTWNIVSISETFAVFCTEIAFALRCITANAVFDAWKI